jgi:hypothetical protein
MFCIFYNDARPYFALYPFLFLFGILLSSLPGLHWFVHWMLPFFVDLCFPILDIAKNKEMVKQITFESLNVCMIKVCYNKLLKKAFIVSWEVFLKNIAILSDHFRWRWIPLMHIRNKFSNNTLFINVYSACHLF